MTKRLSALLVGALVLAAPLPPSAYAESEEPSETETLVANTPVQETDGAGEGSVAPAADSSDASCQEDTEPERQGSDAEDSHGVSDRDSGATEGPADAERGTETGEGAGSNGNAEVDANGAANGGDDAATDGSVDGSGSEGSGNGNREPEGAGSNGNAEVDANGAANGGDDAATDGSGSEGSGNGNREPEGAGGNGNAEVDANGAANGGDDAATDGSSGESPNPLPVDFHDVAPNYQFRADIEWLAGKGITSGWPDGTFRPAASISRAALAAFLYRYAGSPEFDAPAASPFRDVAANHPFYREIAWVSASGIATGYQDGTFRPSDSVTRGAAAVFLWRLAGNPAVAAGNPFTDVGACHAQGPAIRWAASTGIAQGHADHTFRAGASLTRAAFAAFLHRYDGRGLRAVASPQRPASDPALPERSFTDVPAGNQFAGDIRWAAQHGIAGGYADGSFRPKAAVTRDAFVAYLYRFAGSPNYTPPAASPFRDVQTGHPFYREIAWAAASGIVGGYSDGTFRPSAQVSRAAAAAFLYRAAGSPAGARAGFRDTGCSEHRRAIGWLAGAGITTGYADGTFRPGGAVERQAVVAFLHRMCMRGYGVVVSPWARAVAKTDVTPLVGCQAWQNPAHMYQVSSAQVQPRYANKGAFSYVSPNKLTPASTRKEVVEAFVGRALDYLGTKYVWDYALAPGLGVDCAGLVVQAMYAVGIDPSRYNPYDHYFTPGHDHYANDMRADSRIPHVAYSSRQRGDLIFYDGHVAIYLGNDLIVDARARGVAIGAIGEPGRVLAVGRLFN